MSQQLARYLESCRTPRVVCRRGRVHSTRRLDPPPPVGLVPARVVALFERVFGRAPVDGKPVVARASCVGEGDGSDGVVAATPAQAALLRRYGLLVAPTPAQQCEHAAATRREARRAYMRAYERTRAKRPDRRQYQREWFQRKRRADPAWYDRRRRRAKARDGGTAGSTL